MGWLIYLGDDDKLHMLAELPKTMTADPDPEKISVELDEEWWEKLHTLARQQGVSPEEIMRRALQEFLHSRPQG